MGGRRLEPLLSSALPAPRCRGARIRRDDRVPGCAEYLWHSQRLTRPRGAAVARRVRHRHLLPRLRSRRPDGPRDRPLRRSAVRAPGRGDELSHLAAVLRIGPFSHRLDLLHRRSTGHADRRRASGFLRRHPAQPPAGFLAAAAAGDPVRRHECVDEDQPLQLALCHRPAASGRNHRWPGRALDAGVAAVAAQ